MTLRELGITVCDHALSGQRPRMTRYGHVDGRDEHCIFCGAENRGRSGWEGGSLDHPIERAYHTPGRVADVIDRMKAEEAQAKPHQD